MRHTPNLQLEQYRKTHPVLGDSEAGENYGYFEARLPSAVLRIIASDGTVCGSEWEHVSVSLAHRCPTWEEMVFVKELFWSDDETVLQFHPKKSEYVNTHPFVLHLWRRRGVNVQLPPRDLVG